MGQEKGNESERMKEKVHGCPELDILKIAFEVVYVLLVIRFKGEKLR